MGRANLTTPNLLLLVNLSCFVALVLFATFGLAAAAATTPSLHPEEVKALKAIGKRLGKKDWDFGVEPCSGKGNWIVQGDEETGFASNVTCSCSFNNYKTCHVVSINVKVCLSRYSKLVQKGFCRVLTALNISATLPPEFSKFRHLKLLDLSRNYFTGSIPQEWATMKLEVLSFMGNRLSGPFPKVFTYITSLRNLYAQILIFYRSIMSIEGNNFSGPIPPDIGKLINLQKLILSSNAFNGELPPELANLVNLTDMRISDNNFSGKIPDIISNWKQIQKLQIQGCSLEGPIPSSISALTSLSDLRISDLKGRGSPFPPLHNMDSLKTLILRNCLIYGEIPAYIGDMKKLKTLDISYNNLTGEIPGSFFKLTKTDFLYLTGNQLTGSVPGWILERNKNASRVPACLKHNFPCSASPDKYSLHINCGGKELNVNGNAKYEADREPRGASMFYLGQHWALSSTGNFMDNDIDADDYIVTNTSALSNVSAIHSELYTTAHFQPPTVDDDRNDLIVVVGAVSAAILIVLMVLSVMWRKGWLGGKISAEKELRCLDLQTGIFSLRQIKAATKNFNAENKIGEGGFGCVYRLFHFTASHFFCKALLVIGVIVVMLLWKLKDVMLRPHPVEEALSSGYMAPEYAMRGYLTNKADIYSFGVVALEIVSGKSNTNYRPNEDFVYLLDWAYVLRERGSLLELVDPALGSEYSSEEAMVMLNVALLCTNASPTLRPTMSQVVSMLEGRTAVQDILSDPGFSSINSKFKALVNHFWQNPSQTISLSSNGPKTNSSSSNIEEAEDNSQLLRFSSVQSEV
ncbi:hypothetical protein POUND7_013294 [Theobroma cacao]